MFEPRIPSAGQGLWGYLMRAKGKEFLQRLAEQNLFIHRDGQQIAVGLAKGNLAVALGLAQRLVDPYIKGGLPIKPLTSIKERLGAVTALARSRSWRTRRIPTQPKSTSTGSSARKAKSSMAALYPRQPPVGRQHQMASALQYTGGEGHDHAGRIRENSFLRRGRNY